MEERQPAESPSEDNSPSPWGGQKRDIFGGVGEGSNADGGLVAEAQADESMDPVNKPWRKDETCEDQFLIDLGVSHVRSWQPRKSP